MKSIFHSVSSTHNHKSAGAIKENITTLLKETVAQIVVSSTETQVEAEATADLCAIIEAIFLNGLKDGFMNRFRRSLDVEQECNLSFWNLLMEISHQENIKQVENLSTIKTDIGLCRAWIRVVLNETLLSSYLKTIKENRKTMLRYYHIYAYLLDAEMIDIALILIEKVEAVSILLPCNSGILNKWLDFPLSLAGIAFRPMRLNQVVPGVDIAQSIAASSSRNSETCSIASSIISQSSGIGQMVTMNEEEALKMILKNNVDKDESLGCLDKSTSNVDQVQSNNLGYILKGQSAWSSDESKKEFSSDCSNLESSNANESNEETTEDARIMERSYSSIVESNFLNSMHIRTPDFRDVLQRLGADHSSSDQEQVSSSSDKEEKIETITTHLSPTQNESLIDQVTVLGNEKGLDSQDYKCNACKQNLTIISNISVCSFSGNYFCDTCMASEEIVIPARIVYNWDFKKYKVSERAYNCLNEIKDDPLIDFKIVNPYIYTVVDEMRRLQTLRNQLNYLRAYLYTCREPVIEQLQKMMFPREYMYEHIHQYSISDLMQIRDGALATQLEKIVQFGREHVLKCWLCSQKGFLCEICNDREALFPFDTENVYRCNECSGVSHKTCLNALKPCPRCERKQKRDLPEDNTVTMITD